MTINKLSKEEFLQRNTVPRTGRGDVNKTVTKAGKEFVPVF
jgi:hypothetical protein